LSFFKTTPRFTFHVWLVTRFVTAGRRLLTLPAMLSLVGMALGVACLTVAMAVVSGYEVTLKTAIIDVFGHIQLVHRGENSQNLEVVISQIKEIAPEVETYTPFVKVEGLVVGGGKLSGIIIQGIDAKTVEKVLHIRDRVIKGEFSFEPRNGLPSALVGKALAKKFNLEVGKPFKVVIPTLAKSDSTNFTPKVQSYMLSGILDLGKAEYDERTILTELRIAQSFAGVGENFSGIRIKLKDANVAANVALRLRTKLGPQYWIMDWTEVNKNLFSAVKIERVAIFFVILIMVIAACFNIASGLFVSVLQRYSAISILRAIGFSKRDVQKVFIYQGLFFGIVGTLAGLVLGCLLGLAFVIAQKYVVLMPAEAYHLDHIGIDLRPLDALAIVVAATLICLISTLVPARRGAQLDPVEGLRYE
jgi:lipoprotein-releasing system permease protein